MATEKIDFYFTDSHRHLQAVNVDESRKIELRRYAERMMKRQY